MRLLDSHTLQLREFSATAIPPYAILSHTWGESEVSFQDMQRGEASTKSGFQKIQHCCEEAAKDGFEYIWVDTCCIDKSSSAELSEAINSMYRWYREAGVCYVHLEDVPPISAENAENWGFEAVLRRCRWFTRGWTLQELIAPTSVIFFNNNWEEVGTKASLKSIISRITGIQIEMLSKTDLASFSVAQKMSWAAKRKTTRPEDLAYCLMGLFGVHMPMLYGEGERAFVRLQEEIMKLSDDQSLFAWRSEEHWLHNGGLLALSPTAFANSGSVVQSDRRDCNPFFSTNKGINLHVPLNGSNVFGTCLAVLNCEVSRENHEYIGIAMRGTSILSVQEFVRKRADIWVMVDKAEARTLAPTTLYVRPEPLGEEPQIYMQYQCSLIGIEAYGFSLLDIYHYSGFTQRLDHSNASRSWLLSNRTIELIAAMKFGDTHGVPFLVVLMSRYGQLLANVEQSNANESLQEVFSSYFMDSDSSRIIQRQRVWEDELDRVVWEQPNGTWSVSVAIKNQILSNGEKVQAVVLTGRPPSANQ